MASLPVGGIDGTLDQRLNDGPATRNIRAKTGRINGVTTLSGYAWNKEGRLLVFSILVNGFGKREWEANELLDRFCDALVSKPIPAEGNRTAAKAAQGG
jgi:D-alanyl-D-alanine carboxypeptidase/D-alanyl-D-alanine-endopeptidase (penicillin-binding protein 4)